MINTEKLARLLRDIQKELPVKSADMLAAASPNPLGTSLSGDPFEASQYKPSRCPEELTIF